MAVKHSVVVPDAPPTQQNRPRTALADAESAPRRRTPALNRRCEGVRRGERGRARSCERLCASTVVVPAGAGRGPRGDGRRPLARGGRAWGWRGSWGSLGAPGFWWQAGRSTVSWIGSDSRTGHFRATSRRLINRQEHDLRAFRRPVRLCSRELLGRWGVCPRSTCGARWGDGSPSWS